MRTAARTIVPLACVCATAWAATQPEPQAQQGQRAAALIRQLSAEEFAAREEAEKALRQMGAAAFAAVKEHLGAAEDQDVRERLRRILKDLSLAAETDPEALARFAREEAEARRFGEAAQFYARVVARYRELSAQCTDEKERRELEAKLRKAEERRRRAAEWARALAAGGGIQVQGGRVFVTIPREVGGRQSFEWREIPSGEQADW